MAKKETVECKVGDKTDTKTDKGKGLLKWAKSSKCKADNNGGGFTCACTAETASLQNIQCISQDTYSCTKKDGKTGTFSAKMKCKKIAIKSKCATAGATTTAAPTTASTQAPTECTPNADGTCGTPKGIESYVFVNFEGETMSSQQFSNDPRLCHLDAISNSAYVAVGNGFSSFDGNGKSQGVINRVDICPSLASYEDVANAELGVTQTASPNCATG